MSVATAIRRLIERGFSMDQALLAAEVMEAELVSAVAVDTQAERRRAADRERKRLRKSAESAETAEDAESVPPLDKKDVPQTPLEKTNPHTPSAPKGASVPAEFEAVFWPMYPNKVGKSDAAKKFVAARKLASLDTITAGLERYVAKTDDRPWCNPATWLFQQRWADEPSQVARGSPASQPRAPSQADVFAAVGRSFQNEPGPEYEDSRSSRQAIPYLRAVEP